MGTGSGIVEAFIIICLIVCLAVACFPNAGWPLWFIAICTVAFWLFVIALITFIVLLVVALLWMGN